MSMRCEDVEPLVQTHLDGELADEDRRELSVHLASCASCRDTVAEEARFHRELREKLRPPPLPGGMRERILTELDREDWRARKQTTSRLGWAFPAVASMAAACALIFFIMSSRDLGTDEAPLAYDAVRQHIRRPPVEVQGAAVNPWVQQYLSPMVQVPRFSDRDISLRGARLSHLRGRDAALLYYEAVINKRPYEVATFIVDAPDLNVSAGEREVIGGRELWVHESHGYNVVAHKDAAGIAYVFTSEMPKEDLLRVVVTSNLLLRGENLLR